MIRAVFFHDTTGEILQVLEFVDGTLSAAIDVYLPPDALWIDHPTARILVDYVHDPAGTQTVTERPILFAENRVTLSQDGSDNVTFPLPSGTIVTPEDDVPYTTAGADFDFSAPGIGEWVFDIDPPFPHVPLVLTVTAVTRQVQTDGVADAAITVPKADLGDTSNLIKANQCNEIKLWTAALVGGASALAFSVLSNASGDVGASIGKLRLSTAMSATGHAADVATTVINNVVGGKRYTLSMIAKGVSGPSPYIVTLYADWYDSNLTFISTATTNDRQTAAPSQVNGLKFSATAPISAAFVVLRVRHGFDPIFTGGTYVTDFGTPICIEMNNGIFETVEVIGSQTVNSGNLANVITLVSHHTRGARFVNIAVGFRNNTGGNRQVNVIWRKLDYLGNITDLKTFVATIADDGFFYGEFFDDNPTGDETTYYLRVGPAGALNLTVNGRYMMTQAFFG